MATAHISIKRATERRGVCIVWHETASIQLLRWKATVVLFQSVQAESKKTTTKSEKRAFRVVFRGYFEGNHP